jgi:phosphoribosyl-dephospho-CoA transferase
MRRHDVIVVCPTAWPALIEMHGELAADPFVARWVSNGWPVMRRRAMPDERQGIAVGLPLPPGAGKRRVSFVIEREDVLSIAPPPTLRAGSAVAPRAWWPTLDRLDELACRHGIDARVFGSLAWRALTGLEYLTDRSDLDLLLHVHCDTNLRDLTSSLAVIATAAPMRVDGELVRHDGAAVNWRELHAGTREIVIKTIGGVALLDATRFLAGEVAP